MQEQEIKRLNRAAWNREVARGNVWTIPVGPDVIAAARRGEWAIDLTMTKSVPRAWFANPACATPSDGLAGTRVLCLASGGGQQGPVLAAAGATVTVFDASDAQLERDATQASEHGLPLAVQAGFMDDLGAFEDASFDLIFHPVSNTFAPSILPVWREAARVLAPGGVLLAGFMNPDLYLFDAFKEEQARGPEDFVVVNRLPYADADGRSPEEIAELLERLGPLEHSHSLEMQIGGQLAAGLVLTDFYADTHVGRLLATYMPMAFATRAVKLPLPAGSAGEQVR